MLVKIKCAVLLNSPDDYDVEMKYYISLYYSDWHTEWSINSTYDFHFITFNYLTTQVCVFS